jgi:hypothetical protein
LSSIFLSIPTFLWGGSPVLLFELASVLPHKAWVKSHYPIRYIHIYIPICYLCIILASEECRYLLSLWWVHYLPSKQICVMWDMRVWAQVTYIIICARILCDMCHRMHFV